MTTCNNYCDSGKNDVRLCRYCIGNLPEGDDNAAWCNDLKVIMVFLSVVILPKNILIQIVLMMLFINMMKILMELV